MRTVKTSCVVLSAPVYPDIEWSICEEDKACLTLDNAKRIGLYLSEVQRYHTSIKTTCGESK